MPMALQALPPLLTSPMETAPPLAEAVATPPFPAEATSVGLAPPPKNLSCSRVCAATLAAPASPATVPATAPVMRRVMAPPLLPAGLRTVRTHCPISLRLVRDAIPQGIERQCLMPARSRVHSQVLRCMAEDAV